MSASASASAPRPQRGPAPAPFRVVLPEPDLGPADLPPGAEHPPAPPGPGVLPEPRLYVATDSEAEIDIARLPPEVVPVPPDEQAPRGVVILDQVMGRRDASGRPYTFWRRLRHRLFGMALGLTVVSAGALVIGLVGGLDDSSLELGEELVPLGSSAVVFPDDPETSLRVLEAPASPATARSGAPSGDEDWDASDDAPPAIRFTGTIEDDDTIAAEPGEPRS
ncbi:MAG: hypothetical protein ACK5V1_16610 [Planctomycetaceae bacterium]